MIEAVFSYINLLKQVGPQERIFREIQKIEDTSFRFSDEETAVDLVETLSEAMQNYPPEDYLTGSDLYFEYDPRVGGAVFNFLCLCVKSFGFRRLKWLWIIWCRRI